MIAKVDLVDGNGNYWFSLNKSLQRHIDVLNRYKNGKQLPNDDVSLIDIISILEGLKEGGGDE